MSNSNTIIVTKGNKHVNEELHVALLRSVLDAAELEGTWRIAYISEKPHKGTGKFFVSEADESGLTVLIQPDGPGTGHTWDLSIPPGYDPDFIACELRAWNGYKGNTKDTDDAISREQLNCAARFRENENAWRDLNDRKLGLEQQFDALSAELNDVASQMGVIETSLAADEIGKRSWEMVKKILRL